MPLPESTPAYIVAISLLLGIVIWGVKTLRTVKPIEIDEEIPISKLQSALQTQIAIDGLAKEFREMTNRLKEREERDDKRDREFIELRADFNNLQKQFYRLLDKKII